MPLSEVSLVKPVLSEPSLMDKVFPVANPSRSDDFHDVNRRAMHALVSCIGTNTCAHNQTSVVIFGVPFYAEVIEGASMSGERIW
jgi:hypothetical protein